MPFMQKKDKKDIIEDIIKDIIEEDKVRLKPFLGIRPGIYLAFIYGLIILAILFYMLLYPGLKNPGMVLSVNTVPAGAAVRINNIYMDAAPCEIFIPKGRHTVEIVLPGFGAWKEEMEFGGPVFGSRFFPRKITLNVELKSPNPIGAFMDAAAEFAAWSFYGEATQAFQIPLVLSENAYRLAGEAVNPAIRSGMKQTLTGAARYAVTRTGLRDLVRAGFLLDSMGQSPSPLSLMESLENIYGFLKENPQTAFWLAETLPAEAASLLTASSWYGQINDSMGDHISENGLVFNPAYSSARGQTQSHSGLRFREIAVFSENAASGMAQTSAFLIAETPVTLVLWELFLEENPLWRAQNRESLIDQGLADSQYLSYSLIPGLPENTAAWLSWHAAKAFCEWFGSRLPGTEMEVRLPTEFEWEMGVITGLDMVGEFWEWCEEPFVPLNFLPAPNPGFNFEIPERPVRGGSWINPRHTVDIGTRGSLPPDSCSPFVSFRPVIVAKENLP